METIAPKGIKTLETVCNVSISEKDCQNAVKPVVIFNYMQDLAANSIDAYDPKYSCEELLKHQQGWFLIRYRIEFDDYKSDIKQLKIKTESRGCQKMTAFRDFEVRDNNTGERILRASSSWFIVDLENKSVVNLAQAYPDFFKYEKREDDLELRKLRPITEFDSETCFHVRYDDLDINGHVNNTVYISWALEALDFDFRVAHKLKTMDVYFKHEVTYGEDILSQVKLDVENLTSEHLIKNANDGTELCLLKCTFAEM